jgi:cyclopropane fatty-acyl-phospholipid synthase-like methyltransferase
VTDAFKDTQLSDFYPAENMMGPNAVMILQELLQAQPLQPGWRVLDLGCGKGLSSAYLAKECGVQVFAVDLWVPPTENDRRFRQLGLDRQIIPLHADAASLPFADDYFDAVVSIDAYHYFGSNDHYFDRHLNPLLKDGAVVALAVVGMKNEMPEGIPEDMRPFWDEESFNTWHSANWWEPKFTHRLDELKIQEMTCFDKAWADWLATDNPHAIGDRAMMAADRSRYMNLVSITGKNRKHGG